MDLWHIRGGNRLHGSVRLQGSKNASLPVLAASIICPMECTLLNVPEILDVEAAAELLRHLGCRAERHADEMYIDSRTLSHCHIPKELMEEMRSSVIFMGALLCRCGEARLSPPGGCQLGIRPIDLHLEALRSLGAEIEELPDGEIFCRAEKLRGAHIRLPFPSVGATENAVLAACGAAGRTVISGAAKEPEIKALTDFLNSAGACISGAGTEKIVIDGFKARKNVTARIIPDRIAGASLACACAACGGEIEIKDCRPEEFSTVLHFLNETGCDIISRPGILKISSENRLRPVPAVITAPYPGFPTDAQPVLAAALLKADGCSSIMENIFRSRFDYAGELRKLGADIRISTGGRFAHIRGVDKLCGSVMNTCDLRGGAAMIIAALSAEGESLITDPGHVRRGYENFDDCLRSLGGEIYLET